MASSFAAIIGSVGGAFALLGTVILLTWLCVLQCRKFSNKNSDTASSDPSAVESKRGGTSSSAAPPAAGQHEARQFGIEELERATRNFNESNLIGCGSFGLVFKGLLCDGTVVAIKRRRGAPRQDLIDEVAYLSQIWNRNLVTLLGFCQENGYHMLVFEYLPNGNMCNHLHDTGENSRTTLEFKQRLSIAIGAAKGLCHLHSLCPPALHNNFKTANVLVDENFIAKVADAGMSKLLEKIGDANPSSSNFNAFKDPEVEQVGIFSEMSDVYSFGVFLMELITGRETTDMEAFGSNERVLQWVQMLLSSNNLVDHRLAGRFTAEGMRDLIKLMLHCMRIPGKERPKMKNVVLELDRILEQEIRLTTVTGESTTTVTLGSQLFSW
ncbi:proline-rich receptor-like protein kinase PERK13 isoform X2 [Olea europaea var. sylvestris]|uniref:proline-rich receptor-like protein kinase PERK13 isoform X2 n=1 Tax=Olea europaea var. sylvestris TaxID=158386 RepID=UPI000C1D8914|nr:proline-rich receptor-like protein kinase PERK13 isoform X2 [Olea europaea var. sylvestris]